VNIGQRSHYGENKEGRREKETLQVSKRGGCSDIYWLFTCRSSRWRFSWPPWSYNSGSVEVKPKEKQELKQGDRR